MADEDISKLVKSLSPGNRIKKLKEIQKKDQEEIDKAQKLIKDSEEEQRKDDETKKIPIPQLKAENIEQLFTAEEKELFKAKRLAEPVLKKEENKKTGKSLEESAMESEVKAQWKQEAKSHVDYSQQMAKQPAEILYNRVKEIYNGAKENGYVNASQQKELDEIHYANAKKMRDIESGKYSDVTKEAAREMILTEKMRGWIHDQYGRSRDY